jgi:putative transposase
VLIPILYLKGISTGEFDEALVALLGKDAGGLSASTIGRLKDAWSDEHLRWSKRNLSAKHYVYFWADGIHVQARSACWSSSVPRRRARTAWRSMGTRRRKA